MYVGTVCAARDTASSRTRSSMSSMNASDPRREVDAGQPVVALLQLGRRLGGARLQLIDRVEQLGGQADDDRGDDPEHDEEHEDDRDPARQQPVDDVDERVDEHGHDGAGDHPPDRAVRGDEPVAQDERRHDGADDQERRSQRESRPPDVRPPWTSVDTGVGHGRHRSRRPRAASGDSDRSRGAGMPSSAAWTRTRRRCASIPSRWPAPASDSASTGARSPASCSPCSTALALIALIRNTSTMLTRVGLGVLIALALDPIVGSIERRWHLRRGFAVAIVAVAVGGLAALLVGVLGPQAVDQARSFSEQLPETIDQLESTAARRAVHPREPRSASGSRSGCASCPSSSPTSASPSSPARWSAASPASRSWPS